MKAPLLLGSGCCSLVLLALLQALRPTPALACSGAPCVPARSLPMEGTVPQNAVEFLFRPTRAYVDAGAPVQPRLFLLEGPALRELATTREVRDGIVHIKPTAELALGSELRLDYEETCLPPGTPAKAVRVVASAPVPSTLGTLRAEIKHEPVRVTSYRGSCFEDRPGVYADLTVELSSEAAPYAEIVRYQLEVDGKPWESYGYHNYPITFPRLGASMLGPGKDRVYVLCDPGSGGNLPASLAEGVHRVRMIGLLADDTRLSSNEVELTLRCAPVSDAGARDAAVADGSSAQVDASSNVDDAGPADADAGQGRPIPTPLDASSQPPASSDAGDDGCSLAPGAAAGSSAWCALLLAAAGLVQRRRRAAHARRSGR